MNPSRRNGKPASCEPCRKNKTKCDHTFPKCGQCHQRGIVDKCVYHPAPLTKRRDPLDGHGQQSEPSNETRQPKRKRTSNGVLNARIYDRGERALPKPSLSQEDNLTDAGPAEAFRTGYLGPTSHAAILPKEDEPLVPRDRRGSFSSEVSDHELSRQNPLTKAVRAEMAADVLKSLHHYSIIRDAVLQYCDGCQAGVVPTSLVADAVDALETTVDKFNLTSSSPNPGLVLTVLENTSRSVNILPSLPAREFYKICTGENLRFETIGFLLATAGKSLLFGLGPDNLRDDTRRKRQVVNEMFRSSTTCLVICSLISPVNDIMIWMFYENLMLTIMICGYSGPASWRRVGELATQIYALGLHKEPSGSTLPLYLHEIRRRIFCAAYNQDKIISTFLGRPIRLSKRHTDIKMPLDLSDNDLTANEAALDLACQSLSGDGWNTNGRHLRASWIRLRFISSQYREEILDFSLSKLTSSVQASLLDTSRRIRESWDSLPRHLRYWPTCWNEDIPSGVCLMLVIVYLTHFYNEFLIQKLLDYEPLTLKVALLRVSMDLLSTVLTLGAIRDRSYDVHRDFLDAILLFGVPSGSVLATALQEQHQTGQQFPASISRSEIIRSLSVLISHLDNAEQLDSKTLFGDGKYNLCRKAAKSFARVIDAVLDPKPSVTPSSVDLDLDLFVAPGLNGFEGMDVTASELNDGFDWGAIGQWTL